MMPIGSMPLMPPGASPRDQVVSSLNAQVEAGEITAEDQEAMLGALDAMHEARVAEGRPDLGSGPPSKEELQAKFDTLLSEQVEAGTLTQDQADQLTGMFEEGDFGPPPPGGARAPSGETGEMMQNLVASLLEQLQSGSAYDESGDQSSSSVASVLADYTV